MISGRSPDLGVVLVGTQPDERGRTQPQLVAGVVSPGSKARDYQTKRTEYLIFGLREYWIVDNLEGRVTILTRAGTTWNEQVFQCQETLVSSVLPGLECRVADLWASVPSEAGTEDGNGTTR
jgi:Uma2 family endonuclease